MNERTLEVVFIEQRKLTFACLFIYFVFSGIGYAGLYKTANLHYLRNSYLFIMILASTISIYLTITTPKNKRAVSYIVLSIFQLMPVLLGSLCMIVVSIGNLSQMSAKVIASYLAAYVLLSVIYTYFVHAQSIWSLNLKQKKYDLSAGFFYPMKLQSRKPQKKQGNKWIGDLLLLTIVFVLTILRIDIFIKDVKFYLLGFLSVVLSFYFLRFMVNGFIYPLIKILLWEIKNKRKVFIGV